MTASNLSAHNQQHAAFPSLSSQQALAQLSSTAAAARSLGIHEDIVTREGMARTGPGGPLERFLAERERRLVGRISTERMGQEKGGEGVSRTPMEGEQQGIR